MRMLFYTIFASILCLNIGVIAAGSKVHNSAPNRPWPAEPETRDGTGFQTPLERIGKIAGTAGVLVVSLSSGETVLESRSEDSFIPASLMKLLTSYAALKKLGPSFRFTTRVMAAGEPVEGIISGDIWIKGSGDPLFTSDKAVELAKSIKDKGIREIRGGIFVDNSFFQPPSERICINADCRGAYNPLVSAAAIDFNTMRVRITPQPKKIRSHGAIGNGRQQSQVSRRTRGGQPMDHLVRAQDPATLFAHAIKVALERSGVRVLGASATDAKTPPDAKEIASYDSPPLAELLSGLNKYSNNFMAEMLLRSLGGYMEGAPGNSAKGLAVIRTALRESGISEDILELDCGSGLSRLCKVSPHTLCRLLAAVWNDNEIREEFISSLAVNGEKGTLMKRMHKPGVTVRGKTGTLDDVIGFAGYVTGPSGRTFAAAIILNEVRDRFKARQAVDSLIEQVAFSDQ
jgi:D-alanyl-D-alanine carboxypeptidase/D-alanyl-D-alanine-endopeptidase (penicillin-binding protein 4)